MEGKERKEWGRVVKGKGDTQSGEEKEREWERGYVRMITHEDESEGERVVGGPGDGRTWSCRSNKIRYGYGYAGKWAGRQTVR